MDFLKTALELRRARIRGTPVAQISSQIRNFSPQSAYQIQAQLLKLDRADLGPIEGYKMGLTSVAKQKDVGVNEPICGYLIPGSKIEGMYALKGKIHPRIEPEIAVRFSDHISSSKLDEKTILNYIDRIALGIEVLDSRFQNFKFQLADVIADNTSACAWAVGDRGWTGGWDELANAAIVLKKGGKEVAKGTPAAVLNNPKHSVEMFARMAKRLGFSIEAGMWLLTGGITASVPVAPGDAFELESPWDRMELKFR